MGFVDAFSEISEASEVKGEGDSGFCQESLDKYDKILGDSGRPDRAVVVLKPEERENKFDKLFGDDYLIEKQDFVDGKKNESSDINPNKELTEKAKLQKIKDFTEGDTDFEEVREIFAEYYADAVNTNRPWSWYEDIPGGDNLTGGQRKEVRECAREKEIVPSAPTYEKGGKIYADFSAFKVFECVLDKEDWDKTDREQFDKCNHILEKAIEENPKLAEHFTKEQLERVNRGENPTGYTWHHSERDGTMQLVPYGVHNATNHCGGRSEGNWADSPRF